MFSVYQSHPSTILRRFSTDHRMLVEPACGAALSAVYSQVDLDLKSAAEGPIVVVVCGGNMASIDLFNQWRKDLGI